MRSRGTGRLALQAVRVSTGDTFATARLAALSPPMITWARRILRLGTPELILAVEDGRIALYVAAKVCRWPAEQQQEFFRGYATTEVRATLSSRCLQRPQTSGA